MITLYADVRTLKASSDPLISDLIEITIIGLSSVDVNKITKLANEMDDQANAIDCGNRLQIVTRDNLKYTLWNLQRLLKYALRENDVVINFEFDNDPMVLMPDGIERRPYVVAIQLGDMVYTDWLEEHENVLNVEARSYHIGGTEGDTIIAKGLTHFQAHRLNLVIGGSNLAGRWTVQQDDNLAIQTTSPLNTLSEMHTALKRIAPDRDVVIRYSDGDPLGGISVITPDGNISRMHANRPVGIIEAIEDTMRVTPADM